MTKEGSSDDDDFNETKTLAYIPPAERRKLAEEKAKRSDAQIRSTTKAETNVPESKSTSAAAVVSSGAVGTTTTSEPITAVSKKAQLRQQVREVNQQLVENLLVEIPVGGSEGGAAAVPIPHPRQMAWGRKRPR